MTKRLLSLEMWTMPSCLTPMSTKAPKSTTLRTVPFQLKSLPLETPEHFLDDLELHRVVVDEEQASWRFEHVGGAVSSLVAGCFG